MSQSRKIVALVVSVVFLMVSGWACTAAQAGGPVKDEVTALIGSFESKSKAKAGVCVWDLETQQGVVAHREGELFAPASNEKLLTSATILARLGGEFKFVTSAYLAGKDLIVVGSGDPVSGDPLLAEEAKQTIYAELDRWAAAIKARTGTIEGDIVLVPCFGAGNKAPLESGRHPDWPKNQYHDWYCAPVSGLNFNDNCFDVTFALQGGKVRPEVSPASRLIKVVDALTAGKGTWSLRPNGDDSEITLRGAVNKPNKDPITTAVNHPALLLGRVLADRLEKAGVKVAGKVRLETPAFELPAGAGEPVCSTATPLAVAMTRANKRSLNMMAECMFLRAGDGTWAGSAKVMGETLAKDYGVAADSVVIRDGSGMSSHDRVSPAAMIRILAGVLKRPDAAVLLSSLPISGTDGTLQKRMTTAPYRGRVLGKTGYIAGVSALSGYVLGKDKKPVLAFSILVNHTVSGGEGKALEDAICRVLVDSLEGAPVPVEDKAKKATRAK